MTLDELLFFDGSLTAEYAEKLNHIECPAELLGVKVPPTLDGLTYGQLIDLQGAPTPRDLFMVIASAVLGVADPTAIFRADGEQAYGLLLWVKSEIERINDLFKELEYIPTSEEVQAGYYNRNLGLGEFPTLDWYARRMGLPDHDIVLEVPWVRIYACKKIDHEQWMFNRRVEKIRESKAKRRK